MSCTELQPTSAFPPWQTFTWFRFERNDRWLCSKIEITLTSLIPDVSKIGPNYIVPSALPETGCLTVYRRSRKVAEKLAKCCLEVGIGTFFYLIRVKPVVIYGQFNDNRPRCLRGVMWLRPLSGDWSTLVYRPRPLPRRLCESWVVLCRGYTVKRFLRQSGESHSRVSVNFDMVMGYLGVGGR